MIQFADRLKPLQVNVFADMDNAKSRVRAAGRDLIDLSLGSSDLPVADYIIQAIAQSLPDSSTHHYLLFHGTREFREAAAAWYTRKYRVPVDPETEVLLLIGCQEGLAHLPLIVLNPGDFALLMDPGYPAHRGGVHLASGQIYPMPLLTDHGFLPVLTDIPSTVLSQARLMYLGYPHNPTTAIAPLSFFQEAVAFCQRHNLVLAHDFTYADVVFDNVTVPSVLQADPEKTVSIEFFTLSKSYSMGGFRVGYAIGNRDLIRGLRNIKAAIDFNQYRGILNGAIAALNGPEAGVQTVVETFQHRRDSVIEAMAQKGWTVPKPQATMYIWAGLPEPWSKDVMGFSRQLVEAAGVAVAPGVGFGKSGEGYVRLALVHESPVLIEAVSRMANFLGL